MMSNGIRKYLLEIKYKGTKYKGWQKQPGLKTIQGELEKALAIILKQDVTLYVAGRTDAGVHATQQFAHFDVSCNTHCRCIICVKDTCVPLKGGMGHANASHNLTLNEYKFLHSLNCLLKEEDITVHSLQEKEESFHARHSCKYKTYRYYVLHSRVRDLFNETCWQVPQFCIQKAQECAQYLLGTHDFASFQDADCQAKSSIRTIDACNFFQDQRNPNLFVVEITARSFLQHQIRIIIGTIHQIIARKQPAEEIKRILENCDRQTAGPTAPARGLFLEQVMY